MNGIKKLIWMMIIVIIKTKFGGMFPCYWKACTYSHAL